MGVGATKVSAAAIPGRPPLGVSLEPADSTQATVQAHPAPMRVVWTLASLLTIAVIAGVGVTRAYYRQRASFEVAEQNWIDLLDRPQAEVRLEAVRGLGRLAPHSEASVLALSEALLDDDASVQSTSIQALVDAGGAAESALPRLHRVQRDAVYVETRNAAEQAIAAIENDRTRSSGFLWPSIFGIFVLGFGGAVWYFKRKWHAGDAE